VRSFVRRGIEEVDAEVERAADGGASGVAGHVPENVAKRGGTKADGADAETRTAQLAELHGSSLVGSQAQAFSFLNSDGCAPRIGGDWCASATVRHRWICLVAYVRSGMNTLRGNDCCASNPSVQACKQII
jgi:hypothetical protein